MKKIRLVLIAALAVLLALPPLFGLVTESQVRARVASLNTDGTLATTIDSYDRGWFTSTARLTVAPPAAAPGNLPPDAADPLALLIEEPVDVVVDFSHGPVSLRDGFFVGMTEFVARPAALEAQERAAAPASASASASAASSGPYPFMFHGQTTFAGELHFLAVLPPLDRAMDAGALSFSGGRVSGTLAGRRVTGQGEAATLQISNGLATLSLQGLSASVDNEVLSRYVVPGDLEVLVERASVDLGFGGFAELDDQGRPGNGNGNGNGNGMSMFDANGIALRSDIVLDAAANRLDSNATLDVDGARFGADTRLANGRLRVSANRLDAAALEDAGRIVEAAGDTPPQLEQLAAPIERLLAAGPSLTVNPLRFDIDGAPFDAMLSAEASPDALPAGSVDLRSGEMWQAILTGRAVITAEKRLVERIAAAVVRSQLAAQFIEGSTVPFEALDTMAEAQANLVLAMLSAQGIVEDTGSVYRTELRLQNGELTVNGRPMPLVLP